MRNPFKKITPAQAVTLLTWMRRLYYLLLVISFAAGGLFAMLFNDRGGFGLGQVLGIVYFGLLACVPVAVLVGVPLYITQASLGRRNASPEENKKLGLGSILALTIGASAALIALSVLWIYQNYTLAVAGGAILAAVSGWTFYKSMKR